MAPSGKYKIWTTDSELEVVKSQGKHECWGAFDPGEGLYGRSPFCLVSIGKDACYVANLKIPARIKIRIQRWPICLACAVWFYREVFSGTYIDYLLCRIAPLSSEVIEESRVQLKALAEGLAA